MSEEKNPPPVSQVMRFLEQRSAGLAVSAAALTGGDGSASPPVDTIGEKS